MEGVIVLLVLALLIATFVAWTGWSQVGVWERWNDGQQAKIRFIIDEVGETAKDAAERWDAIIAGGAKK